MLPAHTVGRHGRGIINVRKKGAEMKTENSIHYTIPAPGGETRSIPLDKPVTIAGWVTGGKEKRFIPLSQHAVPVGHDLIHHYCAGNSGLGYGINPDGFHLLDVYPDSTEPRRVVSLFCSPDFTLVQSAFMLEQQRRRA